jgi:hypothetical protein
MIYGQTEVTRDLMAALVGRSADDLRGRQRRSSRDETEEPFVTF